MKDYIEREAVLDTLAKGDWKRTDEEKVAVLKCYDRIKKVPAADVVEVRHGHWSMLSYDEAVCTRCGYDRNTPFDSTREARERWGELPPYCEMCGAKMDGGVNDD